MSYGWRRAWNGRLLHIFVTDNKTLCGKNLVMHHNWWSHIGDYKSCKKCERLFKAEKSNSRKEESNG